MDKINSIEEADNIINNFLNGTDEISEEPEIIKQSDPQDFEEINDKTEEEVEEDITPTEEEVEPAEEPAEADQEPEKEDWKAKYEEAKKEAETYKKRYSDSSRANNINHNKIDEYEKRMREITNLFPSEEELEAEAKKDYPLLEWERLDEAQKTQIKSGILQKHTSSYDYLKRLKDLAEKEGEVQMETITSKFPSIKGNEMEFVKFVNEKDPNRANKDLSLYAELFDAKLQLKNNKKPIQKGSTLLRSSSVHETPKPQIDIQKVEQLRTTNYKEWSEKVHNGELDDLINNL